MAVSLQNCRNLLKQSIRRKSDTAEINDLKLKIKAIEKAEKQLLDTMLISGFNEDLLTIANWNI
ncbi:MAG: hypothetical protein J6K48_09755 [Lachnospiraceae bacterium]|nr:hypothetical protein [Lachnospiraceae bacterium]